MGDLAKLKDYVDQELDVRAPFAFLFNQMTQNNPLVAGMSEETTDWDPEDDAGSTDYDDDLFQDEEWETQMADAEGGLYQITQNISDCDQKKAADICAHSDGKRGLSN